MDNSNNMTRVMCVGVLGPNIFLSTLFSDIFNILLLGWRTKFHIHSTTFCISIDLNCLVVNAVYHVWEGRLYLIKSVFYLCEDTGMELHMTSSKEGAY
jgi:hypothetical protein